MIVADISCPGLARNLPRAAGNCRALRPGQCMLNASHVQGIHLTEATAEVLIHNEANRAFFESAELILIIFVSLPSCTTAAKVQFTTGQP